MIEAHATAKYVRTSAQKAKLVLDQIRGRSVNDAFATLRFARKSVAHDIEKVLRSAVANAQLKEGFGGDVDRLVVSGCYANQGPSLKRVRAAPQGRAFRILKRTAHLTVRVAEQPRREAVAPPAGRGRAVRSTTRSKKTPAARKTTRRAATTTGRAAGTTRAAAKKTTSTSRKSSGKSSG